MRLGITSLLYACAAAPVAPPPVSTDLVSIDLRQGCTFDVYVDAPSDVQTYALYGASAPSEIHLPAAYQYTPPFCQTIGAPDSFLVASTPLLGIDSFLTIGDADTRMLSSVGIDFSTWTASSPLIVDDGAVFVLDPDKSPRGRLRLARITTQQGGQAMFSLQGQRYSADNGDSSSTWKQSYRTPLACASGH